MGIKSFQGAREVVKKEYNAPLLVEHYMTSSLVTFTADQSILEIMELFIEHRISGGPVVDDRGKLIGIISEADCMKHISESRYFNLPILDNSVENHMTRDVEIIPHNMNIFDAASHFHKSNRRRLPVLQNGNLVGQISRKDVVVAALKLNSQNWL